jgi:hypothetical protein
MKTDVKSEKDKMKAGVKGKGDAMKKKEESMKDEMKGMGDDMKGMTGK